jgi:hypothetical protein
VPPATKSISLKNGERFIATIGPSNIAEYHSAFDALNYYINIYLINAIKIDKI